LSSTNFLGFGRSRSGHPSLYGGHYRLLLYLPLSRRMQETIGVTCPIQNGTGDPVPYAQDRVNYDQEGEKNHNREDKKGRKDGN